MPYLRAEDLTECIDCPAGKYCDAAGLYDLSAKDCDEGYYCEGASSTSTQSPCDYDQECPTGSFSPTNCEPEEWTAATKQGSCQTCDPGKTCSGGIESDCSSGTYCSGNTVTYCEPGKYGKTADYGKSTAAEACSSCETGYSCKQPNDRESCTAGWLC